MRQLKITKQITNRDTASLDNYLSDIAKKEMITAEEEVVLAQKIRNGDQVALVGFGTFSVRERAARSGRNPQTGETIQISAAKVPSFKAGKALKDACN